MLSKDGSILAESHYRMYQILKDGATATYDSYFDIDADHEELVGTYSCSVLNSAGTSSSDDLTIQGFPHNKLLYLI
jgi:endoglucanase Acf2